MKSRVALGLLALLALAACKGVEGPPVEVTFRGSLVGAGKIIQVQNTTNESLSEIAITVTAPDGESRTFSQDQLGGFSTLEIGWKKLGGWQVPAGATVEVRAKGYLLAHKGELPPEASE